MWFYKKGLDIFIYCNCMTDVVFMVLFFADCKLQLTLNFITTKNCTKVLEWKTRNHITATDKNIKFRDRIEISKASASL